MIERLNNKPMGHLELNELSIDGFEQALQSWPYGRPHGKSGYDMLAAQCHLTDQEQNSDKWTALMTDMTDLGAWYAVLSRLNFDSALFEIEEVQLSPLIAPQCFSYFDSHTLMQSSRFISRILAEAERRGAQHITAPVSAQDGFTSQILQNSGFTISDSTLVHELDLGAYQARQTHDAIRPARESDIDELSHISAACFADRRYNINRFNSDPVYRPEAVASLYEQWITKSIQKTLADEVLVYVVAGHPAAFITLSTGEGRLGRIPLNAVAPEFQGRGIYTALVHAALNWFKERKMDSIEIRTQLSNMAVHRTWQKLGAAITYAAHTYRYAFQSRVKNDDL